MNKIFKVVWSKARNCYVVVSEVAKANGKSSVKSIAAALAVAVMLSGGTALAAEYNDQDYTSDNGTNVVKKVTSGHVYGGAIKADGIDVTLTDCDFKGNSVNTTQSGRTGYGGAVWVKGDLEVNGGSFVDNSATAAGKAYGGAIAHQNGTLDINNTVFENNSAKTYGAAIYATGSEVTIEGSTFKNHAAGNGVIYATGNSTVTLGDGNVFENNDIASANVQAGATLTLEGTNTFQNNKSNDLVIRGNVTFAEGSTTVFDAEKGSQNIGMYSTGKVVLEEGSTVTAGNGVYGQAGSEVTINGATLEIGGNSVFDTLNGTNATIKFLDNVDLDITNNNAENLSFAVADTVTDASMKFDGLANGQDMDVKGIDLTIETDGTAFFNQDNTIKTDGDVTVNAGKTAFSLYGDQEIEAANVTINAGDDGIFSAGDDNPNDVGNMTIKATGNVDITSEGGYAITNQSKNNGVVDITGKEVTLVSNDRGAIKSGHTAGTVSNGVTNISGEKVTIEGNTNTKADRYNGAVYAQSGTVNIDGNEIVVSNTNMNGTGYAISADETGTINVGQNSDAQVTINGDVKAGDWDHIGGNVDLKATDMTVTGQVFAVNDGNVVIDATNATIVDDSTNGALYAYSANIEVNVDDKLTLDGVNRAIKSDGDGTVTVNAKTVDISTDSGWAVTTNPADGKEGSIAINATDLNVDAAYGISTSGGGNIDIDVTNATIDAAIALSANNGSVKLDADGVTQINGKIRTQNTGAVEATFNSEESYLTGVVETSENGSTTLTFNDDAVWNVTGKSNVTNFAGNKGTIAVEEAEAGLVTIQNNQNENLTLDVANGGDLGVDIKAGLQELKYTVVDGEGNAIIDDLDVDDVYLKAAVEEVDGKVTTTIKPGDEFVVESDVKAAGDVFAGDVSLQDTKAQVDANANDIAANKEAIALGDRVNQVQNTQIAQLQSKNNEQDRVLADHETRLDAVEGTVADHETRLDTVEDKVDTLETTVGNLSGSIDAEATAREKADAALQLQVDANADAIADNRVDIDKNAASIGKNTADIAANKAAIDKNADAIADNRADIDKNAADIVAETTAREAADKALQTQIDTNAADIVTNKTNIAANAAGIQQNANAIAGLNQNVARLDGRMDKVGAGAAALAALHPLDYDAENKLSFSAGVGNYAGQTAAAVGAFYRPNEDVMFSIGGTAGNGENMVNAGVSFAIGKGSSGVAKMSKAELVQEVTNMKAENEELKQENKDIRHELNKLKELVMKLAEK